jgi:NhaP-type Na+/H+ and K+/H+ antiporter
MYFPWLPVEAAQLIFNIVFFVVVVVVVVVVVKLF